MTNLLHGPMMSLLSPNLTDVLRLSPMAYSIMDVVIRR